MTATAAATRHDIAIERADSDTPILLATGRDNLAVRAGTVIRIGGRIHEFLEETPIEIADKLAPGQDYAVRVDENGKIGVDLAARNPIESGVVAGFHHAPSGRAEANAGGDGVPAINPFSIWDAGFRPACPDPRGMALVTVPGVRRFWVDIYLLGTDHVHGTSRCGTVIADGRDRPRRVDGNGTHDNLDYATAVEIYAHHGKQLLGAEEFFAAAYGVNERCSRDEEPKLTGDLAGDAKRFVSRYGLFDVTGTMWQWGTDGHPDDPHPSLFGGSWLVGSYAGSRYALLGHWPGPSNGHLSARGRCDHMQPA